MSQLRARVPRFVSAERHSGGGKGQAGQTANFFATQKDRVAAALLLFLPPVSIESPLVYAAVQVGTARPSESW